MVIGQRRINIYLRKQGKKAIKFRKKKRKREKTSFNEM
jgi:hypothetical protein